MPHNYGTVTARMYLCIVVVQLQCAVLCMHCAAHQESGFNMNRIEWQKQQVEKLWIQDTKQGYSDEKGDHSTIIIHVSLSTYLPTVQG